MVRTQIYLTERQRDALAAIAKAGGIYKPDYGKSHGVGLGDAILPATAEAEMAELKPPQHPALPYVEGPQASLQ